MKSLIKKFVYILAGIMVLLPDFAATATSLSDRLAGRILLQVESYGEAWYVAPENGLRYYLGKPDDALGLMRKLGMGITDADLAKIPTGRTDENYTSSSRAYDPVLAKRLSGRILLQVESRGEAWYIYPVDLKRYYLGRPSDAFNLMRSLGLGVTNGDLWEISAYNYNYDTAQFEKQVFDLVNNERVKNGLAALEWNDGLAAVAREHSLDLAEENTAFTGLGVSCNFPLIHHEGLEFGAYGSSRLNNRNIYYFNKSGENIALMPGALLRYTYSTGDTIVDEINNCEAQRVEWDNNFDTEIHKDYDEAKKIGILKEEIAKRTAVYEKGHKLDIVSITWKAGTDIANDTVQGWLNSEGHRKNMLDADFDEGGMGTAFINGYLITTQVFIRRAECGYKNGACCEKAGYYPYCYEPLNCTKNICQ